MSGLSFDGVNSAEDLDALPVATRYVGEQNRDGWQCDCWLVELPHINGIGRETFEYFMGLGHRKAYSCGLKKEVKNPCPWLPGRAKSIAREEWDRDNLKPQRPKVSEFLHSLVMDVIGSSGIGFDCWADSYGYDTDSMKAFKLYQTCLDAGYKLRRCIYQRDIEKISEITQDL